MRSLFPLIASLLLFSGVISPTLARAAIHTTASFDASLSITQLTVTSQTGTSPVNERTLSSKSGYEIDYNVALFDYRTVATLSFMQFTDSTIGKYPLTRIALGGSYHFIRMNGERIILDNQVESKSWGISPALELSIGLTSLSASDKSSLGDFTASMIDVNPRLLVEIPINPSFLLMIRGGYLKSTNFLANKTNIITYGGYVFSLGVKLTTL